jgi:hypothetical protein
LPAAPSPVILASWISPVLKENQFHATTQRTQRKKSPSGHCLVPKRSFDQVLGFNQSGKGAKMDALTLDALVRELAPQLTGAAIAKIHQPDRDTVVLRLWTGRRELALLLCAGAAPAAVHAGR